MSRLRFAPLDMTGRDVPPRAGYEELSRNWYYLVTSRYCGLPEMVSFS